jgi:hypothetical protein
MKLDRGELRLSASEGPTSIRRTSHPPPHDGIRGGALVLAHLRGGRIDPKIEPLTFDTTIEEPAHAWERADSGGDPKRAGYAQAVQGSISEIPVSEKCRRFRVANDARRARTMPAIAVSRKSTGVPACLRFAAKVAA